MMLLRMALLLLSLAGVLLVAALALGDHQDGYDDILQDDLQDLPERMEEGGPSSPSDKDELYDHLANFNAYHHMQSMEDEDWDNPIAIDSILSGNWRLRKIKHRHARKDWAEHVEALLNTGCFDQRFHMPKPHFDHLLEELRAAVTVDFARSRASTGGNDPIYPEVVIAVGLRFLGVGDTVAGLADVYGMSDDSVRRCINMFLEAVDFNEDCVEMKVQLPSPTDHGALHDLATAWSSVSTAYGLLNYNIGAIDGWLPFTTAPNVPNQADYYSGHYQTHGLNVQAMCDPDLLFLYVSVAAPGKVNDARAFTRCSDLLEWLDSLPEQYFSVGDNAYRLSLHILTPFDSPEMAAAGLDTTNLRTFNFYLSQLCMRI